MARPKGVKETRPRRTERHRQAQAAINHSITPLEVMMFSVRRCWDLAQRYNRAGDEMGEIQYLNLAVKHAAEAAPYCHARLATLQVSNDPHASAARILYGWAEAPPQIAPPDDAA